MPGASQALHDVLHETSRYARSLLSELKLDDQDSAEGRQRIIAAACLARLLEASQSILILASYGVREELYSLLRVFYEAFFVLANCCSSEEFVRKFIQRDVLARQKLINAASRHNTYLFRGVNEYATPELKAELQTLKDAEQIQASTAEQHAKNVGCLELYDSIYRVTSASVHTTARCIAHYLESDEDGNITAILHHSDPEVTNLVLLETTSRLLIALRGICECCMIDKSSDLNRLDSALKTASASLEND